MEGLWLYGSGDGWDDDVKTPNWLTEEEESKELYVSLLLELEEEGDLEG